MPRENLQNQFRRVDSSVPATIGLDTGGEDLVKGVTESEKNLPFSETTFSVTVEATEEKVSEGQQKQGKGNVEQESVSCVC